jgi:hypothetical protein
VNADGDGNATMTKQGVGMRQGYLPISICVFGISSSVLFYKLGIWQACMRFG